MDFYNYDNYSSLIEIDNYISKEKVEASNFHYTPSTKTSKDMNYTTNRNDGDFSPFLQYNDDSNFNMEDLNHETIIEPVETELLYECSFCNSNQYCSTHSHMHNKESPIFFKTDVKDKIEFSNSVGSILETLQDCSNERENYIQSNYKKWLINLSPPLK